MNLPGMTIALISEAYLYVLFFKDNEFIEETLFVMKIIPRTKEIFTFEATWRQSTATFSRTLFH